jgi:hypothetical protein
MFDAAAGAQLLGRMSSAQRAERVAVADRLIAVGQFTCQRIDDTPDEDGFSCVDEWEKIAAEVGAELGISRGRASSQMHYGQRLVEHFPKLLAVIAAGEVDFHVIAAVIFRTDLIRDADILASIDAQVAAKAPRWNKLSREKIDNLVDWMVLELDPDAVRVARQRDEDRHIEISPVGNGVSEIWGEVRTADGAAFDMKLNALADSVCRDDPRTKRQRRTDALGALAAGQDTMACLCGSPQCPAGSGETSSAVVIHVLAETGTVEGTSSKPGYVSGYGAIPAEAVQQLAKRARVRPVVIPKGDGAAEPQYRPSAGLSRFVRNRDLTCRWMGCDKPVWTADIDHSVPYPLGPTHPSNNVCYCRLHHLLKTFCSGPGGWRELQLPNGTMIFTSPSNRVYRSEPFGAMLFGQLGVPTGELTLANPPPPGPHRELAMPKRKRTRAQERAYRIQRERNINAARYAADPPPF